jgi:hypothetical protein
MRFYFRLLIFLLIPCCCFSQKNTTTLGIQIKPIFPISFLGTGKLTNENGGVHFETILDGGFSGGLIIRHNFTNTIAIEGGINYVKRKYSLKITDSTFTGNSKFRMIGYEIPVTLMIYAQVNDHFYINGSMGPALDMFASDINTFDYYFNNVAFKRHIFQPAITGNAGVEYRTYKGGTIYIGASYHRPLSPIYNEAIEYKQYKRDVVVLNELSGSYLTVDLRYFFPATKTKKDTGEE